VGARDGTGARAAAARVSLRGGGEKETEGKGGRKEGNWSFQ
jgi:hypothetical protein